MFKRRRVPKWTDGSLRCSFCGKAKGQVDKLVAGPGVFICNVCVNLCCKIIENAGLLSLGDTPLDGFHP